MANTTLSNLINPEVMGDMVSAELTNKLRATGFYKVDNTLVGRAGNTITIPTYAYIGEATDQAEGVDGVPVTLTASDKEYTIKKASKYVSLTDEAVLSGYGDPMGETTKQLRLSIQDKADSDGIDLLEAITASTGNVYESETISYADLIEAQDLMASEEQGEKLYLLASREIAKLIRKDDKYCDRNTALGDTVLTTGAVGTIAGCELVISNKLADDNAFILKDKALTIFMKRAVTVETERNTLNKTTLVSADQYYTVAIEDYSKIVKFVLEEEEVVQGG